MSKTTNNILKTVAIGVGAKSLLKSESNNREAPAPAPLPPPTCISPNVYGTWYKIKNVKAGRPTGVNLSKNEIRCDYSKFPPSTSLKECINSADPVKFHLNLLKKNRMPVEFDDNPSSIYLVGHPGVLPGPNNMCKWTYTKYFKGINPSVQISNTIVPEEPEI